MIVAILLAAVLSGDSAATPVPPAAAAHQAPQNGCAMPVPDPNSREVLVCVEKPQGFRIDPDVMAAKKAHKEALAGRPKGSETFRDRSCAVVGPAGCIYDAPGINLLAAAATLGEMQKRLSKGEEIGSLFVTDPQLSEYQYYQLAKKEREAKEAAKLAKTKAEVKPQPQSASAQPQQPRSPAD